MILALPALYALAQQCAPNVAPTTLLAVVRAESGFDPLAVAVNGSPRRVFHPATAKAAAALAAGWIAAGRSVDLGLGQINSRNLTPLQLSLADAFAPCANLAASARVLQAGYLRAAPRTGDAQRALHTAFSLYNTGDPDRGFANGYVRRVVRSAARLAPALRAIPATPSDPAGAATAAVDTWDVFGRPGAASLLVF